MFKFLEEARQSNFSFGILFMPKEQREAIKAIYAFCRAADDAVDLDLEKGKEKLARLREKLGQAFDGKARDPLLTALVPHIRKFGLLREHFDRLFMGLDMDVERRRFQTHEELAVYADCVAGAVGLLCLQVLGVHENPKAWKYAEELGRGLQLTNIIRDVGRDIAQGRIYIPQEDFANYSYTEAELKDRNPSEQFFNLMRYEVARARGYFHHARMGIDPGLRRKILGPEIMRETYEKLLKKMERVLDHCLDGDPPELGLLERFGIACAVWIEVR